jgi:WD repeat-containing protein 23
MDATLAGTVDVYEATKDSRPSHRAYHLMGAWDGEDDYSRSRWKTCVRDASWHPNAPMIVASAWNGYGMTSGTCTVHSWNDGGEKDEAEPKMGLRVNQKLDADPSLYQSTARINPLDRRVRNLLGGRLIGRRLYLPDDEEENE